MTRAATYLLAAGAVVAPVALLWLAVASLLARAAL